MVGEPGDLTQLVTYVSCLRPMMRLRNKCSQRKAQVNYARWPDPYK